MKWPELKISLRLSEPVFFATSDELNRLRSSVDELQQLAESLKHEARDAANRYGAEVYLNNELIGLCRENGIQVRRGLTQHYLDRILEEQKKKEGG